MFLLCFSLYICVGLLWAMFAYFNISKENTNDSKELKIWFLADTILWPFSFLLFLISKR